MSAQTVRVSTLLSILATPLAACALAFGVGCTGAGSGGAGPSASADTEAGAGGEASTQADATSGDDGAATSDAGDAGMPHPSDAGDAGTPPLTCSDAGGLCAGCYVFCDDFTDPALAKDYTQPGSGWVRGSGSLSVSGDAGGVYDYTAVAEDCGDFDVTVIGKASGHDSFGVQYAAALGQFGWNVVVGNGQAAVNHDILGSTWPGSVATATTSASSGKLHITRKGTTLTVALDGAPLLSTDDRGVAAHGAIGPAYATGATPSSAEFMLFRIDACGPPYTDHGTYGPSSPPAVTNLGIFNCAWPNQGTCVDWDGQWLGRPMTFGETFEPSDTWDNVDPEWSYGAWSAWSSEMPGRTLITNVSILVGAWDLSGPTSGSDQGPVSLAACASGAYNSHFAAYGQGLVQAGLANTWLRIGHEMNGNWYTWRCSADAANWGKCYDQVAQTMRATPGNRFKFIWNPAIGDGLFDATQCWPTDANVDMIGLDAYDSLWNVYNASSMTGVVTPADQAAGWDDLLNGTDGAQGLAFWHAFAVQHGSKPIVIPEWGVCAPSAHCGGDNPGYIQHMFDWMTDPANNVVMQSYFDNNGPTGNFELSGATQFEQSAAAYHRLFGR
jgi:hypothetical protein